MADQLITSITTVAVAIVGIAILAVLVSRNAQTPQVISSAGSAFARAVSAATSPVTGGGFGFAGGGADYLNTY